MSLAVTIGRNQAPLEKDFAIELSCSLVLFWSFSALLRFPTHFRPLDPHDPRGAKMNFRSVASVMSAGQKPLSKVRIEVMHTKQSSKPKVMVLWQYCVRLWRHRLLKVTQSSYPDNIAEVGSVVGGSKFGKLSSTSPMPIHMNVTNCQNNSKHIWREDRRAPNLVLFRDTATFLVAVISASNILAVTPAGGKVSLGKSYTAATLLDVQLPLFQSGTLHLQHPLKSCHTKFFVS